MGNIETMLATLSDAEKAEFLGILRTSVADAKKAERDRVHAAVREGLDTAAVQLALNTDERTSEKSGWRGYSVSGVLAGPEVASAFGIDDAAARAEDYEVTYSFTVTTHKGTKKSK